MSALEVEERRWLLYAALLRLEDSGLVEVTADGRYLCTASGLARVDAAGPERTTLDDLARSGASLADLPDALFEVAALRRLAEGGAVADPDPAGLRRALANVRARR